MIPCLCSSNRCFQILEGANLLDQTSMKTEKLRKVRRRERQKRAVIRERPGWLVSRQASDQSVEQQAMQGVLASKIGTQIFHRARSSAIGFGEPKRVYVQEDPAVEDEGAIAREDDNVLHVSRHVFHRLNDGICANNALTHAIDWREHPQSQPLDTSLQHLR